MAGSPSGIGDVGKNRVLTEMAMGYSRSRVLCAAARLGIADALGDDERSLDELAVSCSAQPASLYRLLRALASLGIVVERTPKHFVLTQFGQPLRKDPVNSEWAAIIFLGDLLADCWAHLTECVRTGDNAYRIMQRQRVLSRWSKDSEAAAIFRTVMGTAPAQDYMPIALAWDFARYNSVADLGGGGGALINAILEAFPHLQGMLVDRQESIEQARPRFEAQGLAGRCKLLAADLCESVPAGADVYVLKHVLHGYMDESAVGILRNCRRVVSKDGRLLVIEFVLPDVVDHVDLELERRLMSDLNMLAVTAGKERNADEWKTLLNSADFEFQRIIPVAGESASIIEALG
jgi:ubiquinone/menaquinone biosynthesis C-methylase UbiE